MTRFLFTAAAALLLGTLPARAQVPATGSPAAHTEDTTIVVQLPTGTANVWQYVGLVLFKQQLAIRASDQELGTLLTDEYGDASTNYVMTVAALVRDQTVVLHGTTRGRYDTTPAIAIKLSTATEQTWHQLDALAHALDGTVTYRPQ